MATKTFRYYFKKGDLPGDQGLSWWTQEDWDRHEKYVEELRASGELGKEDYVDVTYDPDAFKAFIPESKPFEETFTNFGIIIPQGPNSPDGKPFIEWKYKNPDKPQP